MKPQENFNNEPTAEGLAPEMEREMPTADFGSEYNGMYASDEEFKAAEAAYAIPDTSIKFSGEGDFPAPALVSETLDAAESLSENLPAEVAETQTEIELATESPDDVIDVEVKEITPTDNPEAIDLESTESFIDLESDDDTSDIADAFDISDRLNVGEQSLELTPKLKKLSKGIFDSMSSMFSSNEAELPEEVDWRPYIQSETDYDESYDYALLAKIYQARYKRKRAAWLSEKYINQIQTDSKFGPPSPPPETPKVAETAGEPAETPPTEAIEQNPENPLAIEYTPSNTGETLTIEDSTAPLAIGYEKPPEEKGTPLQIEQ